MTSGQSGPYGDPADRPGGNPDQGGQQGGWGQPPQQGWNAPPPPPPQYPGYGAAPSAPQGYGAPEPVERPTTVRAGIGAFLASLILGLIAAIATFVGLDDLVQEQVQTAGADVTEESLRLALIIFAVVGLVFVALYALFIWFAWNGRNWARIVLWVLGGLGVVSGLSGLAADTTATTGFLSALSVFQTLLLIVGIVLLALKPSNEWYRYRTWQRATGQER